MSRGHDALKLLAKILVDLDSGSAAFHCLLASQPTIMAHVADARSIVRAAADATERPREASFERDYCAACGALHPPSSAPEPHGARRSS